MSRPDTGSHMKILKKHAPNVFGDFEIDEEKEIIKEV